MQLKNTCGWCGERFEQEANFVEHCTYHYCQWKGMGKFKCHLCKKTAEDFREHLNHIHKDLCFWCLNPIYWYPSKGNFHDECYRRHW